MFKLLLVAVLSIGLVSSEPETFSFASYYGDHMVLARNPQKAVVWGYTDKAGENITGTMYTDPPATVNVMSASQDGVAGGVWIITFPAQNPVKEGVKIEIMKPGGQSIAISDVLFGDVWICSGQSNMQFTLDMAFNATEELQDASKYPDVRVFTATEVTSPDPLVDLIAVEEKWSLPNKDSLGHPAWSYFSAVCWLYGRNLHRSLHVPIGLISSSWGGTAIEFWSSNDALKKCNITENSAKPAQSKSSVLRFQRQRAAIGHSELWNAMMNPFTRLTIYGVIWYQGEANAGSPDSYLCTFPTMIDDWRRKFNAANNETDIYFPFGFVQLAPWRNETITKGFPDIRWHQTADVGYVPNDRMRRVFMAVALDLPDFTSPAGSIHPRDKQDVAERLTISSLVVAYGANFINFQGPKISSVGLELKSHKLKVNFDQSSVLIVKSKKGFEVCCTAVSEESCGINSTWVDAPITEHNSHTVTLSYGEGCSNKKVVGLRYAWQESPCEFKKCAMYQTENLLPMAPYQILHFNHSSDIHVYNIINNR